MQESYVKYCCLSVSVVVDRRENKDANTGKFELAYKQVSIFRHTHTHTQYVQLSLSLPLPLPLSSLSLSLFLSQPKFDTPAYVGIQLRVEGVAIQQNHTHHRSVPTLPVATLSYTKT